MSAPDFGPAKLGRILRKARRDLDLSQEALARRAGTHPNHIGAIERGTKDLRWSTLERLIAGLDMTPAELFTRYGDATASPQ